MVRPWRHQIQEAQSLERAVGRQLWLQYFVSNPTQKLSSPRSVRPKNKTRRLWLIFKFRKYSCVKL